MWESELREKDGGGMCVYISVCLSVHSLIYPLGLRELLGQWNIIQCEWKMFFKYIM